MGNDRGFTEKKWDKSNFRRRIMRKIFLASSGQSRKTKDSYNDSFLEFLGRDPKGMRLAFIPTAEFPEKNKDFVEIIKNDLATIGFEIKDIYLENESADSLYKELSEFDIIFVSGGNTFYLLDQIRKSGFDKIIEKLLDEGKLYVGISAGSYIACPTIEVATWKNDDSNVVKIKDLTGLNLVPFLLKAHYEPDKLPIIEKGVKKTNL
ncbi:MAG TPA: Type 1 glutamine amidotransferase-like domain-containing protein, partial [Patescibacteria group bacterium]|nr:Type 1 glutamine amidotransferase-like domain-containing protein [Patescibacteria group bacterium]